ncbi:MAG TPA: HEAT repeat domain-containing protein, partial [Planctomycetota bacterium]|nr:HEAT repeat domain-containing protein [Planctomycetota bacterium]
GYRRGAAVALRAIMERYSRVKEMEDSANKAEFRLKHVPRAGDAPNNKIQEITDIEVNNVRKKAAEERRKLPESIETPRIFEALSKVIIDESLDEGPRTEAIKVLTGFDRLQTEAVDVLLQVLQDPNSRVREAAAQACAKVNTQKSDDKHRLADMLMKLVTYEPVNDTDLEAERMGVEQETHPELQPLLSKLAELMIQRKKDEQEIARRELEVKKLELIRGVQRKQANSDLVREKAAISLGLMGVIKGIPALVDSLDDNSEIVRAAALKALLQICEPLGRVRDMTKELPFKIPYDPMAPRSEESKQALIKALEEQKSKAPSDKPEYGEAIDKRIALLNGARPFTDGQKEWQQWWEATRGVDILVTAFDTFVREWSMYDPKVVYDIQGFKIKIEAEARFSVNPQNERERADAVIKEFHVDSVEFHIVDIVDLVQKAQDPQIAKDVVGWLYKFLDGKVAGRSEVKEVTQIFVGNCLARVIDASKDQEARIKVRNVVQGDVAESPEIKTGATYVCAYYPKDMAEIEAEQNAVAQALRDGNLQVRLAACYASGKIGIARTAKELANKLRDPEKIVRLSAARAIGRIAGDEGQAEKLGQDEIFMANVGERIFDETDDPSKQSAIREPDPEVREEICFAFGFIQHHNAFQFLLRARRDMDDRVRYAAAVANSKIGKKDPQSANMLWSKFYAPEGSLPKFSDREGAILSMGDVNSKDFVGKLCERLVGSGNEPWKTWEPHQRVRRAVALALGEIGHKSPTVRAALEKALLDPAEEVRAASYGSLNKLVAGGLSEVKEDVIFTGKDDSKTQVRVEFMAKLPMDVLKRYHTAIKSWLEVKARDTFKDPD